jgi:hypothetical protein
MTKLLALMSFSHVLPSEISTDTDAAGNAKYDLQSVTIQRGAEFETDEVSAEDYISRGYAVRSDSSEAAFLKSVKRLFT